MLSLYGRKGLVETIISDSDLNSLRIRQETVPFPLSNKNVTFRPTAIIDLPVLSVFLTCSSTTLGADADWGSLGQNASAAKF
jgi:hypothetical protein